MNLKVHMLNDATTPYVYCMIGPLLLSRRQAPDAPDAPNDLEKSKFLNQEYDHPYYSL